MIKDSKKTAMKAEEAQTKTTQTFFFPGTPDFPSVSVEAKTRKEAEEKVKKQRQTKSSKKKVAKKKTTTKK